MSRFFEIESERGGLAARAGRLRTGHGAVETPVFMPVGTQGSVKALTPAHLEEIGVPIILGNTYHLNLRPGSETIRKLGGLHRFMGWEGPILTDSGGYQVFSLSRLRKINEKGISFRSHIDGDPVFLGPAEVMKIQQNLRSDIAMVLDECTPNRSERDTCARAVERTLRWAVECLSLAEESSFRGEGGQVFGIVQGSVFQDLRIECAEALASFDFDGFAIGGVSVGETEAEMLEQVRWVQPHLPEESPLYLMGVGTPPQLLKMVALGVDMFDCVMPTRAARHGTAFTPTGPINISNSRYREDERPLVDELDNYTCRSFSRSYLRHLVMAKELLAHTLLTIHNLHFNMDLMRQVREHIVQGDFEKWHEKWIAKYEEGGEEGVNPGKPGLRSAQQ